jgi:hypothetical protein
MHKKLSLLVLIICSLLRAENNESELLLKEQEAASEQAQALKELDAFREAQAARSEYTLSPGQVEMIVELEPHNYGFRTHDFRSTIGAQLDFLFRGRAMLYYDYRLSDYMSLTYYAGLDWSRISFFDKIKQHMNRPGAQQLSLLGGASAKWRLTEWYLRSSVFVEPALLIGHMWQHYLDQPSTHWRIKPGLFAGIDTIFDSGLAIQLKFGVEFPIDFARANPIKEIAEPLMIFGLGLAL